jgi:hypothetical protein
MEGKKTVSFETVIAYALGRVEMIPADAPGKVAMLLNELGRFGFKVVPVGFGLNEANEPTYFFEPGTESFYQDDGTLLDDLGRPMAEVVEIGQLLQLPSKFAVRFPISEDGDSDIDFFKTRAEADAFVEHLNTPEAS